MSKRDYYEILGVTRNSSDTDIKSAYRRLAMKHHPDRNPGDQLAEEKFKEAAEAYAVLADPQKRGLYDRFGHAGVSSASGGGAGFDPTVFSGFEDILGGLGDIFGFGDLFGGGRRRGGPQRGADLRYDLEITFEESARGAETSIQIPRQENCETCRGSGAAPRIVGERVPAVSRSGAGAVFSRASSPWRARVRNAAAPGRSSPSRATRAAAQAACRGSEKSPSRLPAGIATGQQLRLQGEGEAGSAAVPPVISTWWVHVHEHAFFRRDGLNLYCEISVNFTTVALGGEVQVPTLDGQETVKVPEGTQTGTTLRLKGKGMPDVAGRGARPLRHGAGADAAQADAESSVT